MKKKDSSADTGNPANDVVQLAKVRDKVLRMRQDDQAAALAAQFHQAMGWKGKPDKSGSKKNSRKKKRT